MPTKTKTLQPPTSRAAVFAPAQQSAPAPQFVPTPYQRAAPAPKRRNIFGLDADKVQRFLGTLASAAGPNSPGGRMGRAFAEQATRNMARDELLRNQKEQRRYAEHQRSQDRAYDRFKTQEEREFKKSDRELTRKVKEAQLKKAMGPTDFERYQKNPKEWAAFKAAGTKAKGTSLLSNYNAAVRQGYKGSLADWKAVGKSGSKAGQVLGLTTKDRASQASRVNAHMKHFNRNGDKTQPQMAAERARVKTRDTADLKGWPSRPHPRTGKKVYLHDTGNIVEVIDEFGRTIDRIDKRLEDVPSTLKKSHR